MSEADVVRAADRYAAELLEKYGTPAIYSEAVEMIAVAYMAGSIAEMKSACAELKSAHELVRGAA